jgi:hypothetical protein
MPEPRSRTADFPVPPYRIRVHKDAPPRDESYRHASQQIELAGWFQQALRMLAGVGGAIHAADAFAADLSIESVDARGENFHAIESQGLIVFFWISHATRTVYILHSEPIRIFRAYVERGPVIAARRLGPIRATDAERVSKEPP